MRKLPFDSIMPVLLDRLIDHAALTMTARRAGLDKQPEIQREMQAAADQVLERAWLAQVTPWKVTEAAIQARFNRGNTPTGPPPTKCVPGISSSAARPRPKPCWRS